MSDLIDDPSPGQNVPELTVSEISGAVKRTLEGTFGRVRVKGEVGRIIDDLAPAGVGALMVMLEKRKKALEAEGVFAADRKKPIPYLPEVIGVVTSPSGAVIRDILHRLRDRFPRKVLVWPVVVQGEKCAQDVSEAIRGFNALPKGGCC